MLGERRLTDPARIDLPVHRLLREFACGLDDLGAAAVVDAVVDRDDVVADRHLLGDVELLDDTAPHAGTRTNPPHPDAHVVEGLPTTADHLAVEAHQEAHLLGAALPVLGGERIDREVLDADFDGPAGDVDEHRLAHLVALGAVQPALGGPPPIAVHDDGDMVGHLVGRDLRRGGLRGVLRGAGEPAIGMRWQGRKHHGPRRLVGKGRIVVRRRGQLWVGGLARPLYRHG